MRVSVLGGGIAGLTTALAFARQGASVRVFERAPALTEVGAGLQVTPNAGRVLEKLGVWQRLCATGVRAKAVLPCDGATGRVLMRLDLSEQEPGYLFLHRAELIDVLADACRSAGVEIILGRNTVQGDCDLRVGADGLRSETRATLNGQADPFFTGQVAWRAIVSADAPAEARIWMLPGGHVVTYPLSGGRLNIVAVQERAEWAEEGWNHTDDPANLRAAFTHGARELRGILDLVTEVGIWGLFRHPVAQNWVGDAVAIVGDAAHPTLPFLAQGANLAIEDAYALARAVNDGGVRDGLHAYQTLRKPRVTRAIAAANANAQNYHLKGVRRSLSHFVLRGIGAAAPGAFLQRMSWLYDHDVTR